MLEPKCEIHIGTQGWNYDGWVGSFYPRSARPADFLELYCKAFETVEIDSSFYAIPSATAIASWYKRSPENFSFSLKLTNEITHVNRLQDSEEILLRFCERVRGLAEKLALILIQLPPDFSPRSLPALEKFLPQLPPDLRFAIEFRDRHWLLDDIGEYVTGLLKAHHVALTLTDGKWFARETMIHLTQQPTADFAYVRWLGSREITDYSRIQIHREAELEQWQQGFQTLQQNVSQIYGYFNNHFAGHSPASANQFKELLNLPVVKPEELDEQPSLF
jgi:uncharacterized protein YecE (DUF72 family)